MIPFLHANWIYCPDSAGFNSYTSFFDSVEIPAFGDPVLYISSFDDYCIYEDDTPILRLSGQYPCYGDEPVFDLIHLSDILAPGLHRLRFVLYNVGIDTSTHRKNFPGLIYEFNCGESVLAFSSPNTLCCPDENFHSGDSVMVSGQLGFTFRYVFRNAHSDSSGSSGFSASLRNSRIAPISRNFRKRPVNKTVFSPAVQGKTVLKGYFTGDVPEAGASFGELMYKANLHSDISDGPSRDFSPALSSGIFEIRDLGMEYAGLLRFELTLSRDAEILVGWGEHLADGRVRSFIGGRNFACSFRGLGGKNVFTMPFLRFGCRFLEIHVYDRNACISELSLVPVDYPLPEQASFDMVKVKNPAGVYVPVPSANRAEAKYDTWRRIFDVSLRTLRLCMHEHYEDCPWREQALYSMDSRNQMLIGYYAFGETVLPYGSLSLMAKSLRPDGLLELCSPARVSVTIPSFSAVFLTACGEYLDYSEDRAGILQLYPVLKTISMNFISLFRNKPNLIACFRGSGYWNFYEWQNGLSGYDAPPSDSEIRYDAPLCAFVSIGLSHMAKIARVLGFSEDSSLFAREKAVLDSAVNSAFWCPSENAYASFLSSSGKIYHFCELTNALLLCAGAVPPDLVPAVSGSLLSGKLIPVTLSHSIFKYDALLSRGFSPSLVMSEVKRRWSAMLSLGATSFWETDEGDSAFDNAGSLCHGWSGIPAYLLLKYGLPD